MDAIFKKLVNEVDRLEKLKACYVKAQGTHPLFY